MFPPPLLCLALLYSLLFASKPIVCVIGSSINEWRSSGMPVTFSSLGGGLCWRMVGCQGIALAVLLYACTQADVSAQLQAPLRVTYPHVKDNYSRDFDAYFLKQLRSALDNSGMAYEMEAYETPMFVESRSEHYLRKGRYNIHWMHTNAKREESLIPVRVPLFKGLIGWRVLLIAEGGQSRFDRITTLDQLRQLTAGQGHDWPDTQILEQNGFTLEVSMRWESLFKMLSLNRTDFFPRSIIEVWREQRIFADLNLEVEQNIALQYPTAYYFFVGKEHQQLADAVTRGIERSLKNGTFDRHFYDHFGHFIERAKLDERRVFRLQNTNLHFPDDPQLWYRPKASGAALIPPAAKVR